MTIATKNGRVILTAASLVAGNCPCCKKPCGSQSNSGGAGVTVETYDFPEEEGDVQFTYQAFSAKDRFTVYSGEQTFFDTEEPVSGGATVSFFKPFGVTTISVRVEGPSGTAWNYTIGCPQVGACCNGTTCSVKPQSQCDASAGEVFKGVGTFCDPNPCFPCSCLAGDGHELPQIISVYITSPIVGMMTIGRPECEAVARSHAEAILQNTTWTLPLASQIQNGLFYRMPFCGTGFPYCATDCPGRISPSGSAEFAHRISVFCDGTASVPASQGLDITSFVPCPLVRDLGSVNYFYRVDISSPQGWVYEQNHPVCDGWKTIFSLASSPVSGTVFVNTNLSGCRPDDTFPWDSFSFTGTLVYEAVYANPLP